MRRPAARVRTAALARAVPAPSPLPLLLAGGALLLGAVLAAVPARAEAPPAPAAIAVEAGQRAEVVRALAAALRERYVFPEVGEKVAAGLEARLAAGDFDRHPTAAAFADGLTGLVMPLADDRHLRVRHPASRPPRATPSLRADPAAHNYGVARADVLAGNVGYLKLDGFLAPTAPARAAIDAAMATLAGADALVVDLRENGGGSPGMVAYLSGYLVAERTHLNDIFTRHPGRTTGDTEEFWAEPRGGAASFAGKPVYVLTARYTFSGAEEFANNLKELKRAIIVGETTGGGANPGDIVPLGHGFDAFVPTGRAINPISGTNWEGRGVAPDIAVPAPQALEAALAALAKSL